MSKLVLNPEYQGEQMAGNLIPTHSDGNGLLVSGRDLHEFLEIGTRCDIWMSRMMEYGFTENVDYVAVDQKRTTAQGNTTTFTNQVIEREEVSV